MRVLIIAQYFPPDIVGASTRAYNVAKGLMSQNCEVVVVSAFPHYPHGNIPTKYKHRVLIVEEMEGMKIIRTWVPKLPHSSVFKRVIIHFSFFLSSILAIKKVGKIDVIFAANASFFVSFPAMLFKFFLKKEYIRNVDDLWPEVWYDLGYVKSKIFRKILDYIASTSYHKAITITPVSEGYVDTLIKKYHLPKEKIFVIEHGVDIKNFFGYYSQSNIKKIKTLMYSGALSQGYDFDIVLKCAKLLELEPVHFVIRGKGILEDKLRQLIKEQKITNIEINTKVLSEKKLNTLLNEADIFLLPMSPVRGFDLGLPTKTLEYQALGKPIICVSNAEPAKYIQKTQSGLVTSSRDPKDLAELIMQLVHDENLAKQLGVNGRNHIINNLTIEKIGKRIVNMINKHI